LREIRLLSSFYSFRIVSVLSLLIVVAFSRRTSDSVFFGYHAKIGVINHAKGTSGRFIRLSEADPEKNSLPCPFKSLCAQKLALKLGGRHSSPGRE
ncbi:MAG TPA: hypothetical protein VIT23_17915, partial [Terrimicrobiaceae bacterium]